MGSVPSTEKKRNKKRKKSLFISASACLASTNKNTHTVSLELASSLSSHSVTKNAFSQTPAVRAEQPSEDCRRMKACAGRVSAWDFSMLCLVPLSSSQWPAPARHETAPGSQGDQDDSGDLEEMQPKTQGLDSVQRPSREKPHAETALPAPSGCAAGSDRSPPPARAAEAKFRQTFHSTWQVTRP